ncbi:hypothetical protein DITRI_Ditri03aG0015800 [Diplodiscus trichospermus]
MAGKFVNALSASFSEYEFLEGDDDQLGTVVAALNHRIPWIDPLMLKLRHRIGRGPFGVVWLATYHRSTKDYDQYYKVAIKMLHPIKQDDMRTLLDKFDDLYSKCQGLNNMCIIMKFYEGSIGDKMTRLKGGKLLFPYVLRLPGSDMAHRLGTSNYMAPEQWQPEIRGPISFETDSWGFACSIVEMLTGIVPWHGKSADEIYDMVVRKQEKPFIPSGLPPPVEKVLLGCFEYDFRSCPLMKDILHVFQSSEIGDEDDVCWSSLGSSTISDNKSSMTGYTELFLSKDCLQVGDTVRSRKPPNSCKPENMDVPEGSVVGLERGMDQDDFVLVRVHGIHDPLRVHVSTLERVTHGLIAGDWVRLKEKDKRHSPVGILHTIDRDGSVAFVSLKSKVLSPRFDWPRKRGGVWATGKICWILPNGSLVVKLPGKLSFGEEFSIFLADPVEVEVVSFNNCPRVVKKYQHLEDFHWAVRPILVALGLFTTMKRMGRSKVKQQSSVIQSDIQHPDGQTAGNPAWLPPPVANIIFREGAAR